MSTIIFLSVAEASEAVTKLMRAWRVIYKISTYRSSERRSKTLAAALAYVQDVVDDIYDVPFVGSLNGPTSGKAYEVAARAELYKLLALSEKLRAAFGGFAVAPSQELIRDTLVKSALTAKQFSGEAHTIVEPGISKMPPLTTNVPAEA
jgi:hypothetical protein